MPVKTVSKVVEVIYDCALNTGRWEETLGMIAELSIGRTES